jgi:hypothetical protein
MGIIETHAADKSNERVNNDLIEISELLKAANRTMRYDLLKNYFSCLEAFYINYRGLFTTLEREKATKKLQEAHNLIQLADNEHQTRGRKLLEDLIFKCKMLHMIMTDALHDKEYFFRMREDKKVNYG